MLFSSAINLYDVFWKVNLINDGEILQGNHTYETIDRNTVESFELIHRNKSIFKINTNKKTIIHRLKTRGQFNMNDLQSRIMTRFRITAVLSKNKDESKNIIAQIFEGKKLIQQYSYDPVLSKIYYHFGNGKMEIKNEFGDISPYLPIKLRLEELEHLKNQG